MRGECIELLVACQCTHPQMDTTTEASLVQPTSRGLFGDVHICMCCHGMSAAKRMAHRCWLSDALFKRGMPPPIM
jgi:hypothetical protein